MVTSYIDAIDVSSTSVEVCQSRARLGRNKLEQTENARREIMSQASADIYHFDMSKYSRGDTGFNDGWSIGPQKEEEEEGEGGGGGGVGYICKSQYRAWTARRTQQDILILSDKWGCFMSTRPLTITLFSLLGRI